MGEVSTVALYGPASFAKTAWAFQEKENSVMFAQRKGMEVLDVDELLRSEALEKIEGLYNLAQAIFVPFVLVLSCVPIAILAVFLLCSYAVVFTPSISWIFPPVDAS